MNYARTMFTPTMFSRRRESHGNMCGIRGNMHVRNNYTYVAKHIMAKSSLLKQLY